MDEITGAIAYLWSAYPDGIITAGQGTEHVTVEWGEQPGKITVLASNYCGNGLPAEKNVGIESLPLPAGPVTGNDTVCLNHSYEYSVDDIEGATSYVWAVPAGTAIVGDQTGKSVLIDFSPEAVSGDVMVSGKNTCGSGMLSRKEVFVHTCQGIRETRLSGTAILFPNPASEILNVSFPGRIMQPCTLQISDVSGRNLLERTILESPAGYTERIDVSEFPAGVYFLTLISRNSILTGKVLIRKE